MTKFKVRCSRYLYTLCVADADKADKLKQSLPPGAFGAVSAFGAVIPEGALEPQRGKGAACRSWSTRSMRAAAGGAASGSWRIKACACWEETLLSGRAMMHRTHAGCGRRRKQMLGVQPGAGGSGQQPCSKQHGGRLSGALRHWQEMSAATAFGCSRGL